MRSPVHSVLAFRIAMYQIVVSIRSGDVPYLPYTIVPNEIRLINASTLPLFIC